MAQQIIRSIGSDGKYVLSNILDKDTGKLIEFKEVSEYYDGTSMSDDKMDIERYLYIKNNGKYYLRVLDNPDKFLEKDTMLDMRNISNTEILLLKMGYYKGVKINGYYSKGDTPAPIEYYLSDTTEEDDGGSVIDVGGVKLDHEFVGACFPEYFGVKSDGITDDSVSFQKLIDRLSDLGGGDIILPSGVTVCNITIPSKVNIVGQGSNVSILKSANGSNKDVIKGKDFDVLTGTPKETPETRGVRNITFRGFSVDGNKQNNSNGYGIRIWGCSWKWEDVIVANCKSGGIWTEFTTHEYPNDDFSAVLEALESNFTRIKTIANDGNGWDWHGVHDSEINDYVTFRNKGWGFNQVKGSVNGYHWNSWLNYHSFNFESYVALDNITASGEEGIGISMPQYISSCKITNVTIAGHETGLIMRGSLHYIQGYIQNITDTAIVNDNMAFCNIDLIIYNVKYLYKQINNGLYNRYNIIGQQLEGQSILEAGNGWFPNVLESCYLAVKQPSDVIYINRVVGDKLWINGWKPTIPGSNGVMLTNNLMPSDSTATDVSSLVNDFNILLQRLREGN